jgi:hypothetical protein
VYCFKRGISDIFPRITGNWRRFDGTGSVIVTTSFELEERGRAMLIYAGISMLFMALGPLVRWFLISICFLEMVFLYKHSGGYYQYNFDSYF